MSHLTRGNESSSWETTSVLAAMRPGVVWSPSSASVAQLASSMIQHGVHAVVVAASSGAAPLMASDLDLVRAAVERADTRAGEIAREPAASVPTNASLEQAIRMMSERYIAHLLVTDADSGAPAGIISSFDVAAVFGGHDPDTHVSCVRRRRGRWSAPRRCRRRGRGGHALRRHHLHSPTSRSRRSHVRWPLIASTASPCPASTAVASSRPGV